MPKRKQPATLSETQLEMMNIVWEQGEVTVAQVWQALSRRREVARNTVQTMLTRLEDKGWLKHKTVGNTFVYRPAVPRDATRKRMVKQLLDVAFDGSAENLVMTLLDEHQLSKQEADRIRKLIDEAGKGTT